MPGPMAGGAAWPLRLAATPVPRFSSAAGESSGSNPWESLVRLPPSICPGPRWPRGHRGGTTGLPRPATPSFPFSLLQPGGRRAIGLRSTGAVSAARPPNHQAEVAYRGGMACLPRSATPSFPLSSSPAAGEPPGSTPWEPLWRLPAPSPGWEGPDPRGGTAGSGRPVPSHFLPSPTARELPARVFRSHGMWLPLLPLLTAGHLGGRPHLLLPSPLSTSGETHSVAASSSGGAPATARGGEAGMTEGETGGRNRALRRGARLAARA